MNAQEWNRLRKNWDSLLDVYPSDITRHLFQNGIITSKDKMKVDKGGISSEKMERLLSILKSKPTEMKAFNELMTALELDHSWLAKAIRETESHADESLKSQEDPHLVDSEVRRVLHKNFVNTQGASVKLADIRETLQRNDVFVRNNEWKNEVLADFVWKEFIGVDIQKKKKPAGKNTKIEIWLQNICKIDPTLVQTAPTKEQPRAAIKEQPTAPTKEQPSAATKEIKKENDVTPTLETTDMSKDEQQLSKIQEMGPTQLKEYLHSKMVQSHLPTDILDEFEKENIGGSTFLTMKEKDLKEIFPSATFGVRRFLSTLITEYRLPPPVKTYPEYLRKFSSEVKHTDNYIKNRCVDADVNVRGKTTDPLRNFHLILDQNKDESLEFIGSKVVPFVSACLNDRRDGTIYFGISPSKGEHYKHGEIVGVDVSKEEVLAEITYFLKKSFLEPQQNIIFSTVRDAKFVPVISDVSNGDATNLWVVEVDVVPSSVVMKDDKVRTKLKCLPIHAKKHKSKEAVFRFSSDGVPEIISSDGLYNFEKDHERIVQQRQEEEAAKKSPEPSPNLRIRLLNLLTGGSEILRDTIYPFLMTSSIDTHMDKEFLSKNMTFITSLSPEVVYDFDPTGSTDGLYTHLDTVQEEVMRVLTTDNFDKLLVNKEEYKIFTDSLAANNRIPWVFCNGYGVLNLDKMEPTEWNRKRRDGFQECFKFYKDNFDKDRIIVIICLFSKKYEVMLEACEEVLTKLPDNWLLLADSHDTAKLWQNQILNRNKAEKQAIKDRCIIGMPWEQVNLTINRAISKNNLQDGGLLPTSTGAFVEVREKKLKDWCDIEVLSAQDFIVQENEREKIKKEVEERFYRGDQASWLNFLFHDQVLKRDIHDTLMQAVNDALEGKSMEEEDKVTSVSILHQPGAGGTTSAKQVLWDLRKKYRCCIVTTITDQTCDQLEEVRIYGDSSPKPLLILIDNEEDDKMMTLIGSLEERSRRISRFAEKSFNVYFTVISCTRKSSLPKQIKHNQISLCQELKPNELEWFKVKNESLESRFNKDKEQNVNPKFLISFNILRENFNKEYISKVVKEFSDDVKNAKEVKLLKIISLLNTYDLDFKPVPVSCLDKILDHEQNAASNKWPGTVKRNMKWEANLSQGVNILLNLSSNKDHPGKARSSLRVFNKNIAQEILTRMKERTDQKESEIMLELLESGIFEQETSESKKLQTIINNVIRKRDFKGDGIRRNKFSKFVLYVKNTEGAEVAVKILEQLFELNQNHFTAQLISRFYIEMKNWKCAKDYAKRAINMFSKNSYLWDTYGQVYKNQLFHSISPDGIKDEDIHGLIELSEKCIEVFRTEQKVSEQEDTTYGDINFAGHFGELRAIVLLLSALKMCPSFSEGDILHRCLVEEHFRPARLNFLNELEISYLKNLERSSKETIRRLDEEYLQMKGSSNLVNLVSPSFENDKKSLLDLKINLDEYFGEASNDVPRNLNEADKCEFIRRRVNKLGAKSLYNLLILRQNKKTDETEVACSLIMQNVKSNSCTFHDLKTLLDTVTVLLVENIVPEGIQFNQILEWCRKLYLMNKPQETDRWYLETFLYFVLYNFPTEERQMFNLCAISELSSALEKWQEAFKKNYPKSCDEEIRPKRRETTLFFLGNGPPLQDIIHQDALREMEQYRLTQKWDVPEVRKTLRMMSGSLCDKGEKVTLTITTKEGNKLSFSIQTSHKVSKKDMRQKKVFFYVGFSFSGPRAYGMSPSELGVTNTPTPRIPSQIFVPSSRMKQPYNPILLTNLFGEWRNLEFQMKKKPQKKTELEKKIQRITSDMKKVIGE